MKRSLFIFSPYLPYHFHPVHWDQTTIIVCQSLGSRPTQAQELFTLVPMSFEQPAAVCPFNHFNCYLQETPEDTSLRLGLSPLGTGTPDSLLMPRNCFINFAVEHWFGCHATEPGFAGDIGAVEIWLIDTAVNCKHVILRRKGLIYIMLFSFHRDWVPMASMLMSWQETTSWTRNRSKPHRSLFVHQRSGIS